MRNLCTALLLLLCTTAFAQSTTAQTVVPSPEPNTPKQWGSLGATTTFVGTGLTLAYGQEDFFAPGNDARFGVSYFSTPNYYDGGSNFGLELSASALAYTYDPEPEAGLALVAYGGLGPRLLVLTGVPDYTYYGPEGLVYNAYLLSIGGVGGLETRLNNFGVYLELELALPTLGLVGPRFRVFPFDTGSFGKLTLGANYYF